MIEFFLSPPKPKLSFFLLFYSFSLGAGKVIESPIFARLFCPTFPGVNAALRMTSSWQHRPTKTQTTAAWLLARVSRCIPPKKAATNNKKKVHPRPGEDESEV
jgi:hypothetical protein